MRTYRGINFFLLLFISLLLMSCSGSGSSGGGIGGSGFIAQGSVTAFGSIFVNRNEIDTSEAVIIVNGEEVGIGDDAVLANLDIGMVVTVMGWISEDGNTVVADEVIYSNNVTGPVRSIHDIHTTAKEIIVLGQTVIADIHTEFREITIDTLEIDDVVEVSGLVDDIGAIRVTFLEKTGEFTSGLTVEVTGPVADLDTELETFKINDLMVDYSMADTSGLPGGTLTEGLLVEVEGILDDTGGEVLATEIELEEELGDGEAYHIEIAGFVTDFVSVFEFTVGNQLVNADSNTLLVDGTWDDLAAGVKLEVEGTLEEGILFAEEIEFWDPDQIEVEGYITDFVSAFEFTVEDQVVNTDAYTVFVDGTPEDLALGVMIEVKGSLSGDILVADKVSFEEA